MLIITIKQGKEKGLLAGDPWIYLSAIDKVEGKPQERNKPGATAIVQSSSRQFLARAAYNAKSQIAARVWTLREDEPVDHALIKRRVQAAVAAPRRRAAAHADPQALVQLVDGEKDGLPGLLVHSYGGADGYLICQFNAGGVDLWKVPVVQALLKATGCRNVYERCDPLLRKGEGLPSRRARWRATSRPALMVREGKRWCTDGYPHRFHLPALTVGRVCFRPRLCKNVRSACFQGSLYHSRPRENALELVLRGQVPPAYCPLCVLHSLDQSRTLGLLPLRPIAVKRTSYVGGVSTSIFRMSPLAMVNRCWTMSLANNAPSSPRTT
jgi:23S rRNA (cytosine1962-C5)-methyltransferase